MHESIRVTLFFEDQIKLEIRENLKTSSLDSKFAGFHKKV